MAQNRIAVQVYRCEVGTADGITNYVTQSYADSLEVAAIMDISPVNVLGGSDLVGLPYLYAKITKKQFGLMQEFYVMNSVQDIQNKCNA